jgi:transcriptional regulator with XRE-family HTH domain
MSPETERLAQVFRDNNWKQQDVASDLGYADHSLINKYLRGRQSISDSFLYKLSAHPKYRVSVDYIRTGRGPKVLGLQQSEVARGKNSILTIEDPSEVYRIPDPEYVSLPYLPTPARASFVEMTSAGAEFNYPDRFSVLRDPNQSYEGQIVIEVNGDSMEPYYPSGTKVRCKQIDKGDWPYINSGVFAVSYASSFVIKRIKSNDYMKGYLTLHSDNTETGGSVDVPMDQFHSIFKVLRIVDAPAR